MRSHWIVTIGQLHTPAVLPQGIRPGICGTGAAFGVDTKR
jgi:hypothetical protein